MYSNHILFKPQRTQIPNTQFSIMFLTPGLLSFKQVPWPLSRLFRGYFHSLFISLEGITQCSELTILSQDLSVKRKNSYFGSSTRILRLMHKSFHHRYNAESSKRTQLCFVLFGHKYLVTNGKQVVNALVNKVKKQTNLCASRLTTNVSCRTVKAKFKRKELPPFLIMTAVYTC